MGHNFQALLSTSGTALVDDSPLTATYLFIHKGTEQLMLISSEGRACQQTPRQTIARQHTRTHTDTQTSHPTDWHHIPGPKPTHPFTEQLLSELKTSDVASGSAKHAGSFKILIYTAHIHTPASSPAWQCRSVLHTAWGSQPGLDISLYRQWT